MKRVLSIFVLLCLCIGVVGCGNSDKAEKSQKTEESSEKKESKEVDLGDYPKVDAAQKLIIKDFDKYNNVTEKPIVLTQGKAMLIQGEYVSVEYTSKEISISIAISKEGDFTSFVVESLTGERDDAFFSAVAASIMLDAFGFSESDKSALTKIAGDGVGDGQFNGFNVIAVSTGEIHMITFSK